MIPGRDKPHIYKLNGYWYAMRQNHVQVWQWRKAVDCVRQLNDEIRKKSNEKSQKSDRPA